MRSSTKRGSLKRAKAVAQALVDLLSEETKEEHGAIIDAVLTWMQQHGLSRQVRSLPRLLQEAWHEREGTVPASASTPRGDLEEEEREVMLATLAKVVGKKVVLEERADPTLIGGAVLAIGDERLDGSLRGALAQLQRQLAAPSEGRSD